MKTLSGCLASLVLLGSICVGQSSGQDRWRMYDDTQGNCKPQKTTRMAVVKELINALDSAKDAEAVQTIIKILDGYRPESKDAAPAIIRALSRLDLLKESDKTLAMAKEFIKSVEEARATCGCVPVCPVRAAAVTEQTECVPCPARARHVGAGAVIGGVMGAVTGAAVGGTEDAKDAQPTSAAACSGKCQSSGCCTGARTRCSGDCCTGCCGIEQAKKHVKDKLTLELISLMNEVDSPNTFAVVLRTLMALQPEPEIALPTILKKADQIGLLEKLGDRHAVKCEENDLTSDQLQKAIDLLAKKAEEKYKD